MKSYPKIAAIQPLDHYRLLVTFHNQVKKVYDCSPLLEDEVFAPIKNDSLFLLVKVDQGGYGVSWNDEIDLAESELWIHGQEYKF